MSSSTNDGADVRSTLQAFQDGYTQRSGTALDAFMRLFVTNIHLEVIGTSAVTRTTDEWCVGQAAVRALIEADWRDWGDLVLDVAGAAIQIRGDVAWLATTGTLSQTLTAEQRLANLAAYLHGAAERQTAVDIERELLLVMLGAASTLANIRDGDRYTWPLRLSAVLVRQPNAWQFCQLHFSYPTIHDPDIRLT